MLSEEVSDQREQRNQASRGSAGPEPRGRGEKKRQARARASGERFDENGVVAEARRV